MTLCTLLGDRRRRKDDGRKSFFFAIAVPFGPKVHTEAVRSLCFLAFSLFWGLTKRNYQSEYCLDRRDFYFNRKLDMSFSEADRMELDSTSSSSRKWDFLPGNFREGRRFDWRSMVIYRYVMTWKKI